MFIQEIIIEGFKSYAHRTVIEGFDPHFNAITGLNGSGKSNILDAICFVLGITNLSQVRAGNLSELVYKQGQAGVQKATVTLVFDNSDAAASPVGYEACETVTVTRQVLLGGKSKYLINGRTCAANQVQSLFHSVQLNVNNPHFLIMQGRITKVLNMKPREILGMVEEAAGTRLYETRRVTALQTLEKKDVKLQELNSVLQEEITPTLERLRGEKQAYLQWSKNAADLERLERFVLAYEYFTALNALQTNTANTALIQKMESFQQQADTCQEQIAKIETEIEELTSQLSGEFDDMHTKAKQSEQDLSKQLVQVTSVWQHAKSNVEKAEAELTAARNLVQETEQAVQQHETAVTQKSKPLDHAKNQAKEAEEHLKELTNRYQNMAAGISDDGATLPEQISQAHSDSKTAQAKVEQAQIKMRHLTKQLKEVEKEIQKEGRSAEKLTAKRDACAKKVDELTTKLNQVGFSEDEFSALEEKRIQLSSTVADLSDLVEQLTAQLEGRLRFEYSDPVRGFDRTKVKGLVAKLVQVKDSKNATALEVVAGGKLYQVVVDEAITGKALLNKGQLKRRVTIIPLDKITPRNVSEAACQRAANIAQQLQSTSSPAIELVWFDEEVRNAMEYVFGSTLVVDGSKAANQICDATKTRTVTLDGDVYDPSGTISGGSRNQLGTTLAKLSELTNATKKLEAEKTELEKVNGKIKTLQKKADAHEQCKGKLELAQAELDAASKHLSQTSFGLLVEKRDVMTKDLQAAQEECVAMEKEQEEKWKLYERLKEQETELTQQREDRLGSMERAIQQAKKDVAAKQSVARQAESQTQTLALELESLQSEVMAAKEAATLAESALSDACKEEAEIQMKVGQVRALFEDAKGELGKLEQQIAECSSDVVTLKRQRSDLVDSKEKAVLEAKKLSVAMSRIDKERAVAEKTVESMSKKHPWMESEKGAFGVAGGDYDFGACDPQEIVKQVEQLKSDQETLAKKINKKVMGMIEKAEGEYTELLRKRKVVENDKKKIIAVIEELDEKKKTELSRTWVKVNGDFGSIFSTLLPGASAKIEPPQGMEAWEGLEVKVAFGGVWKESLSELSGGQRSLLALSLILSLLLFKPAPMYILDEVDAALDLSHTQNIGNMLKTHFSQSQFLVVSLKEGMFNNANVIFRTKFVDGVSTVTRTIGIGSSRGRALIDNDENNNESSSMQRQNGGTLHRKSGKENAV